MFKSGYSKRQVHGILTGALGACGLLCLAGCGGSTSSPGSATSPSHSENAQILSKDGKSPAPPTAAIGATSTTPSSQGAAPPQQAEPAVSPAPSEKTPEQLLGEMIDLRAAPISETDPKVMSSRLQERNKKLADMAHDVIRLTHNDKAKGEIFNGAVRFLVESQFQLASGGSQDDAKELIDDAKALFDRDPASVAAAEAGFAVVRLAHNNARQFGKSHPQFVQEFAIQARSYANRFKNDDSRAVTLLSAAAQTCEQFHMDAEALGCYSLLRERFPKSPQAEQAAGALRRLELKGRPLQFGGETRDGGFLQARHLRGRATLIVFWESESDQFQEILPDLKKAIAPYERSALNVIGVCLDENANTLDAFVRKNGLPWPEIFYSDPNKRQSDLPLVKYYGVHEIPSIWLVNSAGIVLDTHVTPATLGRQLKELVAIGPSDSPQ